MFSKVAVRKVQITVLQQHLDALILKLGKAGILQIQAEQQDTGLKNRDKIQSLLSEEQDAREIETTIQNLQSLLPPFPVTRVHNRTCLPDPENTAHQLIIIRNQIYNHLRRKDKLSAAIGQLQQQAERIQTLDHAGLPRHLLEKSGLCFALIGILPETPGMVFHPPVPCLFRKIGRRIVVIGDSNRQKDLLSWLRDIGFIDETDDLVTGFRYGHKPHFAQKKDRLRRRLQRLEQRFQLNRQRWSVCLDRLQKATQTRIKTTAIQKLFLFSRKTVLMTGWAKCPDRQKLENLLTGICGNTYILQIDDHPDRKAPVVLNNYRLLKPFELLVRIAGLPGNNEIDPTPFAALSYALLFGLMFGDVGQGLALMLIGFCLKRLAPRIRHRCQMISDTGGILLICGFSAAVFGLLYGSVFSCESLIPALWFHPMAHINDLFLAVILIGGAFIFIGLLLNIVNTILSGNLPEALLDRQGATGLALYMAGFYVIFIYSRTGTLPRSSAPFLLLGLLLTVFMLRDFIRCLFPDHPKPCANGLPEYLVETIVEILEMASGFLGNTISFIRAGAFALSHAGLSLALYTLAGMIHPDITHPIVLIVIILGNVFIILLEGLICAIQSMRLEFYEFFGKFFRGDGNPFTPFSLTDSFNPATGEAS